MGVQRTETDLHLAGQCVLHADDGNTVGVFRLELAVGDSRTFDTTRDGVCPYKGLAAYQLDDARYFCGREALIDELVRRLQLHQVLVVGGPSGSGKSSLVRAGLLPALRDGVLPGSEHWNIVVMTPGRDPLHELCTALGVPAELRQRASGDAAPERDPARLRELIASCGLNDRNILIFVDQFEELFTLAQEPQRAGFFALLAAVTDLAHSRVKLVVAVRADFYGACAQVPWLAGRITNNQVLVGPMTRTELQRAIAEPARLAGLYLEQGLVEAILEEAGSETGSLPLMSHALVETWVRRRGNTLTLEGFRAAGGVAGGGAAPAVITLTGRSTTFVNSGLAFAIRLRTMGAPHRCVTLCCLMASKITASRTSRIHTLVPFKAAIVHGKHQPLQ